MRTSGAAVLTVLPLAIALSACDTPNSSVTSTEVLSGTVSPGAPTIIAKAIEFHGGAAYHNSKITMTITSLSGSFRIEATRDGGRFEQVVVGTVGPRQTERRVRLTNDTVQEWQDGSSLELDEEGERLARAHVNARVFFPLLPYSLSGGDIRFEDLGLDTWHGRDLHKVKVTFNPGTSNDADDSYMFWFDPDSGRVEQFGYDFDTGLRYRKAVEFDRVGGILFSTQENYAIDGIHLSVDILSPEYVTGNMELLSTVVLSNISVDSL